MPFPQAPQRHRATEAIAGARVTASCSHDRTPMWGIPEVSLTDALGETWISSSGYGLPATCKLRAESSGFESAEVLIADICMSELRGDAHFCQAGVWAVSLKPLAPPP